MKFFIGDTEIKTVVKGALIKGSVNLVSRSAAFSFVSSDEIGGRLQYRAKIGSKVTITNNGKNIFKGNIVKIEYIKDKSIVNIEAEDILKEYLGKKIIGRIKGHFTTVISTLGCKVNILQSFKDILKKEINIVNLEKLSVYDILKIIFKEFFKADFKIYVDGDGKINILLPFKDSSIADIVLQKDVIEASYKSEFLQNGARIKAIGNDDVISGRVIRLIDYNRGISSYFVVEKDSHSYGDIHTIELELAERRLV